MCSQQYRTLAWSTLVCRHSQCATRNRTYHIPIPQWNTVTLEPEQSSMTHRASVDSSSTYAPTLHVSAHMVRVELTRSSRPVVMPSSSCLPLAKPCSERYGFACHSSNHQTGRSVMSAIITQSSSSRSILQGHKLDDHPQFCFCEQIHQRRCSTAQLSKPRTPTCTCMCAACVCNNGAAATPTSSPSTVPCMSSVIDSSTCHSYPRHVLF